MFSGAWRWTRPVGVPASQSASEAVPDKDAFSLKAFLLVHLWDLFQFISEGQLEKKAKKGHPRVWCVIIFLMTVSSEKMDQIQEGSNCGCSKRFISRHVLREGIRHWLRRRKEPWPRLESQKNNKQHPTSVYNYQLHPFLWDEIRSLGHGIISVVLKRRKKGTKGLLTASFCLLLQPKARLLFSSIARSVSPISFWCPDLKVKDLPYYSVPPRFYL